MKRIQRPLRFGDVILLHSKTEAGGTGYVFSETSSSRYLTLSVFQEMISPDLPDIRMAAFRVVAPNKSKTQESLKMKPEKQNQHHWMNLAASMHFQDKQKNKMRNNELQEKHKGTVVLYGSVIQLLHISTNKYVTVSTLQTSKTEYANMQINLLDHESEKSLFRILPCYKVKSVGDEVRIEDHVIFESEKAEGMYLHTSSRTYNQTTLHENTYYEINASVSESGYTIKSHYYAMPNEKEFVKGGSIIRLMHSELECYLVAEGSFANDYKGVDKVVVEEVHLRKRKSEHGILKAPSTSSITYWQIENEKEPLSGQAISWEEPCRIKHLPTRLYLGIVKLEAGGYKVVLKNRQIYSNKTDIDTVFKIFPVIQQQTAIQFNSYARINHPYTNTWLGAQKGRYTRKAFNPNAPGLAKLQWDFAELFQVSVQDKINYHDAFAIEEVDEMLIQKFTYVAGVIPIMKAYIKELNFNPQKIGVEKAEEIQQVLKELIDFVKRAHPRMKDHQKLLRNLMVLEMIVHILKKFNPKAQDASVYRPVCRACYYLMEAYLLGHSRKNENYLGRFINFFEEQIGMNLHVEQMLTELIRDNAVIVFKYGENEINNVIKKLIDSKNYSYFEYLGVLCVCNGHPIPDNQDIIIKKLIKKHGKDLFYLTKVCEPVSYGPLAKQAKEIKYCKPGDCLLTDVWHPLSRIASKDGQKSKEFWYLVAQFDLFGRLCKGNNKSAIETIDKEFNYLTFEEALIGAKDDELHCILRYKYVELIILLYVDVGDNRAILDELSLSFVYKEVSRNPYKSAVEDQTKALTGVTNEHFPKLKEWILSYVREHKSVVASAVDKNNLNTKVLELLYLLVKYGYYSDRHDINALISPLISLLDGKYDKPFPCANSDETQQFIEEKRFEDNYENRAVFNMKIKALKIMDLFFNFRIYLRLHHFIYDYKILKEDVDINEVIETTDDCPARLQQIKREITQQITHAKEQMSHLKQQVTQRVINFAFSTHEGSNYLEPPEQLKDLEIESHELRIHRNENLMKLAVEGLKHIFSLSRYDCDSIVSFPHILMDLSLYQNDELLHESLHLLGKIYSGEEDLFEKATQAQLLITRESKNAYKEIEASLPKLRHYAGVDMSEMQYSDLSHILDQFTAFCHWKNDEPHKQNQKILYNTGVLSDVLNLIFQNKSTRQITDDGIKVVNNASLDDQKIQQRKEILERCLEFLRLLAKDNMTVKVRLFDHMDDLLLIDVAIPHMANLLSEVFTGGRELCLKIKPRQINSISLLIAYGGTAGRTELLDMLQAIVKVEKLNLPLKRNQSCIIKYFSKTRDKFCDDLLGLEEEKVMRRKELLIHADSHNPTLQMLLKLCDLLASCSEGDDLYIDLTCQNVIGISELLQILCMHKLDPLCKKPFVRFLLWVYMDAGVDKIQTNTILSHDSQMWSYLEHISSLLDGVLQALANLPNDEQKASARQNLTSQSTRIRQNKLTRNITMSTAKNVPFVTNENGELFPGLLLYLMEGILPMLKVYYTKYLKPVKITDDSPEQYIEREVQSSAAIACSLMNLADVIKDLLTSQEQFDVLCTTIITIIRLPCVENVIRVHPKVKQNFDDNIYFTTARIESLEEYKLIYEQEILLNTKFNNFVRNYELAYWGPNTASHQIKSPYKIRYSEFENEFLDEKGDEWLPLGKSFQDHIKLYISGSLLPNIEIKLHYVKRIVDCLESSYNNVANLDDREHQKQDKDDIRYLQMLRALIHNQVLFVHPEKVKKKSKYVISVQNEIQNLGNTDYTVKRISKLLAHPNDKIFVEVLALLSMLLYNGNRNVQEGFGYLMHTRAENLYINVQQRLQQTVLNNHETRMLLAQYESYRESQRILKEQYVIHQASSRPAVEEASNPKSAMHSQQLDGSEISIKSLLLFDDPVDLSTKHQPLLDETCEMQILNRAHTLHAKKELAKDNDENITSLLKFQDTSYIDLTLRVLGLMCDGQYRPMQNFLREQPNNIKTINLVSETCSFLSSFFEDVTKDNIVLITTALQTLIEMSVGNFANQQVLFNCKIIDTINVILQPRENLNQQHVFKLKLSAVTLLEVMCEEMHMETKNLVINIYKSVDISALHDTLSFFHEMTTDDAERAAFKTYHVLVHLADFEGISLSDIEPKSKNDAWNYCQKKSRSIEVIYKNEEDQDIIATVHFRSHQSDQLSKELIKKVTYQVNRSSPEDKYRDFLKWMKTAEKNITYLKFLRKHWYTSMFIYKEVWRNHLLFILTLVMNILLIIAWSDVDLKSDYVYSPPEYDMIDPMLSGYCTETACYNKMVDNSTFTSNLCNRTYCEVDETVVPTVPDIDNYHWFFNTVLYIGGVAHLVLSVFMVTSYFLVSAPNFVLPDCFYQYILQIKNSHTYPDEEALQILGLQFKSSDEAGSQVERTSTYSDQALHGFRPIYHIVFVACSILSLLFHGYFYCVCLLQIVLNNDILQRVLRSVTKNGRSLLWVGALGLVVLYIYSVGTFAFLSNEFHEPDSGKGSGEVRFCRSFAQCFITVLEHGLLDTLGSAVNLPMKFKDAAFRAVFYDLTFFIIVTTIGKDIVFGIIVDTFSELRNEKWQIDKDKKEMCFICCIARCEFEKRAKGFHHHVMHEHCMWDYIYYYFHLKRIDASDHSPIEKYVYEQIKHDKIDFFPMLRSKNLKVASDQILPRLDKLEKMIADIKEHFQYEEIVATLHKKREEQAQWEKDHINKLY